MEPTADKEIDHRQHPFELPEPGDVITSGVTLISYHIGLPINSGGFGTVFECVDVWGDPLVAKVLRPIGDQAEMEGRANSEVVAGAIARSRHIVHVADAFVYRGAYYIISESCEFSLREMMQNASISRHIWFPSLVKSLLHGLHFMHTRGLVHCDVHEGNILIHLKPCILAGKENAAYDFKLGDFGQTRSLDKAQTGSTWNESCLPPEILDTERFGPIDHRADLYQAGLVLLRFLSSDELEFDVEDIVSGRPREISESLQHPAGEAISHLLRRHVDARPENALEAWDLFRASLALS